MEIRRMETIEYFSDFLRKIGAPNFLVIGIAVIVIWLLISGIRKGLRKGGHGQRSADHDNNDRDGED
jgi:hypothetical protein